MSQTSNRPASVTVDLAALSENARATVGWIGPRARLYAVVKANAYGHGLVPCARAALEGGSWGLAVAIPEEGAALREAGFTAPVLVMGACDPGCAEDVVRLGLDVSLSTADLLCALEDAARALGQPARVHVKVDTGMGRVGLGPEEWGGFFARVAAAGVVEWVGLMTHFATADDDDPTLLETQWARFREARNTARTMRPAGSPPLVTHAANSAAICRLPESYSAVVGCAPAVRAGLLTYGIPPLSGCRLPALRPALSLSARVTQARTVPEGTTVSYGATFTTRRKSRLAVVPLGYADGYARAGSNRAFSLLRGRRAPVAGRICMDQFVLDATETGAEVGDEVVLIGRQGDEEITVNELATWTDTVHHEVLARLGARLPRFYRGAEAAPDPAEQKNNLI